nr:reverse transcriptase domain-containing protein [Tanacetum cinerariifolium]
MQTHSSSRLVSNPSSNPPPSTNPNPKGRNHRRSKQRIEEFNLEELSQPIVMMADQRIMAQMLQAPTEDYEDEIVVPAITTDNFELKHAWDIFKDLLRAFSHHGFSELHQLDTFYNALNLKDQDSLNSAAGGNFLDKMPHECLAVIESKSIVRYSHNKPVVAKVSMNTSTSGISPDVAELKDMVKALLLDKKSQNQAPATVKVVKENCVTCRGAHSYRNCPATDGNVYRDNIQEFVSQASAVNYNQGNTSYRPSMISNQIRPPGVSKEDFSAYVKANDVVMRNMQTQGQNMQNQLTNLIDLLTKFVNSNNASTSCSGTLPSNTIANPRSDLKAITTRSGMPYNGPQIPPSPSFLPKMVENEPDATNDTVHPTNNGSTKYIQPLVVQTETPIIQISKPIVEPVISSVSAQGLTKDHQFLIHPECKIKSSVTKLTTNNSTERTLLGGSTKEVAKKLGDPGKFLIPCDFFEKAECLSLADLGASINLMPLSVWNKLSLPELTPTCMTLELADRSISRPVRVAEYVYVKVGTFHFLDDFVVVDFDADPRVPLILKRSFLKTGGALIDVFEGELTLRVGKEAITFNLDLTSRYSANYNDMTAKRIEVIYMACEEYSQEVLGFFYIITSGNPIPYYDPIVSITSLTLTTFENSDFLFEEVDAFLALEDDPTSPKFDQSYLDSEGDIILLEAFMNDDPSLPPPNQGNYLPEVRKELKICEAKYDKSSIDEPLEVELKDLPPHLEYAFLEVISKFPSVRKIKRKPHSPAHTECLLTAACLLGYAMHHARFRGIEVDKAKVDVITKLPHPTTVKGIRSFLGHASFYRRFIKDFSKIARLMTRLLKKDTPFIFSKECVDAFQTLQRKLTEAPILIAPDWYSVLIDHLIHRIHQLDTTYQTFYPEQRIKFYKLNDVSVLPNDTAYSVNSIRRTGIQQTYIVEPESRKYQQLPEVPGKGKANVTEEQVAHDLLSLQKAKKKKTQWNNTHSKGASSNLLDPPYMINLHSYAWTVRQQGGIRKASDHRKVQLNELNELRDQAYENSLIYKEKTKRLHDSKIKDCVFNIGDRVLLFNSLLKIFSGKLKSRWSGPFTIYHVYLYGTVELSQPDGPNFKVNGHRLKHYFGEDLPKLVVPDLQTFPKDH